MKKVVTIGGGTGSFALLSGLKKYPLELSAIVSMADLPVSCAMSWECSRLAMYASVWWRYPIHRICCAIS
ncbi:MAG: hypothetical protein Q8O53_01050 [Candidatus Moranbacteria bacterium]|nr:hypothetical protein [Candidatus Moranbacteria bacterium]